MAYTFTTEEKAIVTLCNGDLSKLEQAHKAGQLSFAAAMQAVQDATTPKMVGKVKMQPSGTVTLTGLRSQYGASYYPNEWKFIAENLPEILKIIEENAAELERRGQATRVAKAAAEALAKASKADPAPAQQIANPPAVAASPA